jgi:bacterioferritin
MGRCTLKFQYDLWHTPEHERKSKGSRRIEQGPARGTHRDQSVFFARGDARKLGYRKLSQFIKKQSIGEMKHAEVLLERILFLDGVPTMEPLKLAVGSTVRDMIEADLKLEISAVAQYNAAVQIATEHKDNGSRDLLVILLKDEESHVDWLEAQVHQIKEMGYERYLTMQTGEFKEES